MRQQDKLVFSAPPSVMWIVSRLRTGGFSAFPAGGCVRDLCLGRKPEDWDIATSARPEEVMALFPRVIPTGLRHGTVTVLRGRARWEVTTFRAEGAYLDGRRPETVEFLCSLASDLARRDFTVNAMALGEDGSVIDLFGGLDDLAAGRIRCVGDPSERFREDALRMLRCLRFAAVLGFSVERGTWEAVRDCAPRARLLSAERVRDELGKMLLSRGPARLDDAAVLGLLDGFLSRRPAAPLPAAHLKRTVRRPAERWAGWTALLFRGGCVESPDAFLSALRLPRRLTDAAAAGASLAVSDGLPDGDVGWRTLCHERGVAAARCAAAAADALEIHAPRRAAALEEVLRGHPCLYVKELALSGRLLQQAGLSGADIGRAQKAMMAHVLLRPEDNTPVRLRALLRDAGLL